MTLLDKSPPGRMGSEPTIIAFHLITEIHLVLPYLNSNLPFQGNAQIGHSPVLFLLMIVWHLYRSLVNSSLNYSVPPLHEWQPLINAQYAGRQLRNARSTGTQFLCVMWERAEFRSMYIHKLKRNLT
jgi:hypothetical protein